MFSTVRKPINKSHGRKFKAVTQSVLIVISLLFSEVSAFAQCAMCRAALESGGDTAKAEAVNDGIVYLMVIPYILVGAIGFMIYISRKKNKKIQ